MNHQRIQNQLLAMQRSILSQLKLPNEQGNTSEPPDFSENTIELDDISLLFTLDKDSRHQLNQINNALNRLKHGNYDRCSRCGKSITEEFFKADPLTDICHHCAEKSIAELKAKPIN